MNLAYASVKRPSYIPIQESTLSHTPDADGRATENLRCMQVWGGNDSADEQFCLPELDVWVWSQPCQNSAISGGDVHYLSSCASGRITRIMLADVCGREQVFSNMAREFRTLLMRNINRINQSRFVEEFSHCLEDYANHQGYVSALISTFFAPTRSFELCNVGHAPPLVYRSTHSTWSAIEAECVSPSTDGSHPGVMHRSEYQRAAITLADGDMVLLFSDRLTDLHRGDSPSFGQPQLLDVLQDHTDGCPPPLNEVARSLGVSARDEFTMILCGVRRRKVALKDNLLAPLRLFGRVKDRTRLK